MKKLIVLSILAVLISFTAVQAQSDSTKVVDKKEFFKEKATIFPNPFSQKLTINVPEKTRVFIYNNWGELIYKEVIETSTSINTTSDSKWRPGIYMVIIIPDRDRGWSEKQTIKIHKQN
jgi:hypothetical protein